MFFNIVGTIYWLALIDSDWQIETIFQGKACLVVQQSASSLTERLAQTAHEIFDDFEEAIKNDSTKIAVHDGTVHPLTSYVINYVKFLFE